MRLKWVCMKREAAFAASTTCLGGSNPGQKTSIPLVYYPPYHSKYNAIERYWAGLEKSWNGYLLSTASAVLNRAGNFLWKGARAIVRLLDAVYEKGVKVCGSEKIDLEHRLQRSADLPWWDITIHPKTVTL